MTLKNDLLGQMRYEWLHVGRSTRARSAMTTLAERHQDLDLGGLSDLCDVVSLLEARGGRNVLERAEIVRALLEEANDPQIHRALLQTLIPGIVSVCRQLRFGDGIVEDPSETVGVALGLASELLVDWAGQSRQYAAPDILSALRGRLRRWLLKEKRRGARSRTSINTTSRPSTPRPYWPGCTAFVAASTTGSRASPTPASTRDSHFERWPTRTIPRRPRCRKSCSTSLCAS